VVNASSEVMRIHHPLSHQSWIVQMPFKGTPEEVRKYHREWVAKRRSQWFLENGPCVQCGSWERLELDHIDRSTKVSHSIWSWSQKRRDVEIAKCQVLCHECHYKKTVIERGNTPSKGLHGTITSSRHCSCEDCKIVKNAASKRWYSENRAEIRQRRKERSDRLKSIGQ
jgi:hypothetical protein